MIIKWLTVLSVLSLLIPVAKAEVVIDERLVNAVIWVESSGNPKAVSSKDARGLMQIRKIAWEDVRENFSHLAKYDYEEWVFNPTVNRSFGIAYLELLKRRLGNKATLENILAAYNWGLRRVKEVEYNYRRFPASVKEYISRVKRKK